MQAQSGACLGLDQSALQRLIDAAWQNPKIAGLPGRRQDLLHLQGHMALARGDAQNALQAFNRALQAEPKPAIALKQAAVLGAAGQPCAGLAHLDLLGTLQAQWQPRGYDMAGLHQRLLRAQNYWQHEIDYLRTQLQDDAQQTQPLGCPATYQTIPGITSQ